MTAITQSDWRRWAIMQTLYYANRDMTTGEIVKAIEEANWNVWPKFATTHGPRSKAVKRTIENHLEKTAIYSAFFERASRGPVRYRLTREGKAQTYYGVISQHAITPEKSHAKGAFK
jgi:hypothetical protein